MDAKPQTESPRLRIHTLRWPEEDHVRFQALAKQEGQSANGLMIAVLTAYMDASEVFTGHEGTDG